jgi:hypothetical protein
MFIFIKIIIYLKFEEKTPVIMVINITNNMNHSSGKSAYWFI